MKTLFALIREAKESNKAIIVLKADLIALDYDEKLKVSLFKRILKFRIKHIIYILIVFLSINCNAQQDLKYASINILSSSLISGIGSGIHKHSGETFGHAFVNGVWKGAIGGSVQFTSKKMIQQSAFENNYNWVWPARLVNSLGNSMVWNGCYNEKMLSKVYCQFFIGNVTYSFKDRKFDYQFDPLTIGYAIFLGVQSKYSFDALSSLKTGNIVFNKFEKDSIYDNPHDISGQSIGNTIYTSDLKIHWYDYYNNMSKIVASVKNFKIQIICHEIIHTFQYNQFNPINSIYLNYKLLKHININGNFGFSYYIAGINGYSHNFFENEADHYGYSVMDHNTTFH
jgi:hypothetical protein